MPVQSFCSACSIEIHVKDALIGRAISCPKCGGPITVTASESAAPTSARRGTPSDPNCTADFDPLATMASESAAEVPADLPNAVGQTAPFLPGQNAEAKVRGNERGAKSVTVPGYEIDGVLGCGGMGVVYKARHLALKRMVALKMMRSGVHANTGELTRFKAEAEVVARLQHPNIVQIYDVGEQNGQPYCALELVEGGSLAQKLDGTPWPSRRAASMVETLACAVQAAHDQGVVHRDLKPANVLMQASGGRDQGAGITDISPNTPDAWLPKIADFGLAKRLDDDSGQTQSGQILGTPAYMAPEQAMGEEIGPAVDIYALGAILYELLTGRPPFKGTTILETMEQVRSQEPVSPRLLNPTVARDLETICLKCLEKNAGRRYGTAWALAEDLQCFLRGEPVLARPVGRSERALRWAKRNPAVASLATLAVLLLVGGIVVSTAFALDAIKQAADANTQRGIADGKTADAERLASELGIALGKEQVAVKAKEEALQQAKESLKNEQVERRKAESVAYAFRMREAQAEVEKGNFVKAENLLGQCDPNLRGWEHRHLLRQAQRCLWSKEASSNSSAMQIKLTNVSTDGKWVAQAYVMRTLITKPNKSRIYQAAYQIQVWNTETGQVFIPVDGLEIAPKDICVSADGAQIAAGCDDAMVRVWDIRTGKLLHTLRGHKRHVYGVGFSPDGKRIVSTSYDDTVKIWDLQSETATATSAFAKGNFFPVRFSPDGSSLIAAARDQDVHILDGQTAKPTFRIKGHATWVQFATFSTDGKRILSVGGDGTAIIWDAAKRQPLHTLTNLSQYVRSVGLNADGKLLAVATIERHIKILDVANGQLLFTLPGNQKERSTENDAGMSIQFNSDGTHLVSVFGTVKRWDVRPTLHFRPFPRCGAEVTHLDFSPDGKRILGCAGATIHIWDVQTGTEILALKGHSKSVAQAQFSPDGNQIVSASFDASVKLWDAETGLELRTFLGYVNGARAVCFTPNGKQIVSADGNALIKVWGTESPEPLLAFKGSSFVVFTLNVSPDGQEIVAGVQEKEVKIWNAITGKNVMTLPGHDASSMHARFSFDGKRIITAGGTTVKVWDHETGRVLITLTGHTSPIRCVRTTRELDRIITTGWDNTLRLWNAETGHEAILFSQDKIISAAVSPNGQYIVTGTSDGTVKLWDGRGPVGIAETKRIKKEPQ